MPKKYIYCQLEHIARWPIDVFVHTFLLPRNEICAYPNNVLAVEFLHESGRYASVACHHRSCKTRTSRPTYLVENGGGVRVRGLLQEDKLELSVTPRFKRVKLSRKWSRSICVLLSHWVSSSMDTWYTSAYKRAGREACMFILPAAQYCPRLPPISYRLGILSSHTY